VPRMNYRGSYRKLAGNSTSAMMAAVEVYNKPRFAYRDEVVVILMMNAWELLLKAIVSKAGKSIFEKKVRGQPYRTLTWGAAFSAATTTALWPKDIPAKSVRENLELLALYRNTSVHFYNEPEFGKLLYSLMQTSLFNYRDILQRVGLGDLSAEATWRILPLGFEAPFDAVTFLAGKSKDAKRTLAVDEYVARIKDGFRTLEDAKVDTGRFLTEYQVHLASTKKISDADITVGVAAAGERPEDAVVIPRNVDPNESHPYLQKDILRELSSIPGFNSWSFQAVVWKYELRGDKRFVWRSKKYQGYYQWSGGTLSFIRKLKPNEILLARDDYSKFQRQRRLQ
jgi:EC042_2821-lke REase/Protein of unknown function (DUF3644)